MRVEKHSLRRTGVTNEWFNLPLDFVNNNIPDTFGVNDAENIGSNAIFSEINTNHRIRFYDENVLDGDWSFIGRNLMLQDGFAGESPIVYSGAFRISLFQNSEIIVFRDGGIQQSIVLPTISSLIVFGITYNSVTNELIVYANGIEVLRGTHVLNSGTFVSFAENWEESTMSIECSMLVKKVLTPAEITNNQTIKEIRNLAISNNSISHYFRYTSGGIVEIDEINGGLAIVEFDRILVDTIPYFNMELGFDIYQDSLLNNVYIALNQSTGVSFGLDLSTQGLTFVATVIQNGNSFLNCETKFKMKEPISQAIINKDTSNFFQIAGVPKEISYANLLTAPSYVNYVLGVNFITNVTI